MSEIIYGENGIELVDTNGEPTIITEEEAAEILANWHQARKTHSNESINNGTN
ncbi:MAG: hypothetical protein WD061_03435 [Candidatus Saccharimonadales bacterium]